MKLLFLFLFLCSISLYAQNDSIPDMSGMKKYIFVELRKGSNRNQDSATQELIQKGHIANITRLANEKKIVMAGPMLDDVDLRGIFVFNMQSKEEVEAELKNDPAIKSGRLRYEIYTWFTEAGRCLPKAE